MFLEKIYQKFGPKNPIVEKEEILNVRALVHEAKNKINESIKQKNLLELMAHSMGGMVWIKRWDNILEVHTYEFANFMLCEKFFCFTETCLTDCTTHVKNKSDLDLVAEFRERTGKQHTFGDLCFSTDMHATEQAIIYQNSNGAQGARSCRYLEAGYIDGNPVLLDVVKTPLFAPGRKHCWSTHTYSVGNATDASNCCDSVMGRGLDLISLGQATRLSNGVIWIYPEGQSCAILDKELEDGAGKV